jgi:uncharacterized protein
MKADLLVEQAGLEFKPLSPIHRAMYVVIGTVSLGLGILGAILPGMPSTVFFLITIGCYARSSERLYRWLLTRKWLQKPLTTALSFKRNNAVPVRIKVFAQSVAWSSAIFLVFSGRSLFAQVLGFGFALSCTIAMAVIKTMPDSRQPRAWTQRNSDVARQLVYGVLSGALGGLIWGAAARVILRFTANVAGVVQLVDVPNTLVLLVVAAVFGAMTGAAYAAVRRVLPSNQWLRGAAFGLVVGLTLGVLLYGVQFWQFDLFGGGLAGYHALASVLFVPAFSAYGLVTSLVFGQLEKR